MREAAGRRKTPKIGQMEPPSLRGSTLASMIRRSSPTRSGRLPVTDPGTIREKMAARSDERHRGTVRRGHGASTAATRAHRNPRVSLGMPVYNGEQYVEAALDSILAQTFTDFELIISDNGSTDATLAICRRYEAADPRITLHSHRVNRGGTWNFNFVFREARGGYFKWACHDDLMAPTMLERCVEVLDEHPDVIVSYPKTLIIDAEGRNPTPYEDGLHLMSPCPAVRLERVLFRRNPRCNPALGLIRTAPLGPADPFGSYVGSDHVFLAHLALHGKYFEIPDVFAFRRDHPGTSVRAFDSVYERNKWYNPSSRSRVLLPTLKYFVGYLRSIARSPIPARDKLRCTRLAVRSFRWSRGDLWREVRDSVRRLVAAPE